MKRNKLHHLNDAAAKIIIGVIIFLALSLIIAGMIIMTVNAFRPTDNPSVTTETVITEDNFITGTIEISDEEIEEYDPNVVYG